MIMYLPNETARIAHARFDHAKALTLRRRAHAVLENPRGSSSRSA
jgi:hypothetical protein